MKDATRVLRAGIPDTQQGEPLSSGPTFAGTYHASGDPSTSQYTHGRYHNPTWTTYEKAITDPEGGTATIAFSSGMAATNELRSVPRCGGKSI